MRMYMRSPSSLDARRGIREVRQWKNKRLYDGRMRDPNYGRRDRRDGRGRGRDFGPPDLPGGVGRRCETDFMHNHDFDRPQALPPVKMQPFTVHDKVHWLDKEDGVGALSRIRLILVGTQSPGNVGAVCRAAANFECKDVWLVNPECDYHADEAKYMATNTSAKAILEKISITNTLREALAECKQSIGFTRRERRERISDAPFANLQLPAPKVLTGLIFGREDDGLTNEELTYCTHLCTIPTSKWEGSLNLSHAVTLALGRLYESYTMRAETRKEPFPNRKRDYCERTAPLEDIQFLMQRFNHIIKNANVAASLVLKPEVTDREGFLTHVRKLMYKSKPTVRELGAVHGFLSLVEGNSHTVGNLVCQLEAADSSAAEEEEEEDYDTFLKKALADQKVQEEQEKWPLENSESEAEESEYESEYEEGTDERYEKDVGYWKNDRYARHR